MKRKVLWQNDFVILCDAGDFHKYDGLTGLFVKLVNADNELLKDAYMKKMVSIICGRAVKNSSVLRKIIKIEALFSDFKKDGYSIRQTLTF